MGLEDFKLIFETERRILKRRSKELLPAAAPAPVSPEPRSRERRPPVDSTENRAGRKRKAGATRTWVGSLNFLVSMVFHITILALLLPHLGPPKLEEKPELDYTVRLVSLDPTPEEQPPAPSAEQQTTPEIVEDVEKVQPVEVETEPEEEVKPPTPEAPPEPAPSLMGEGGGGEPSEPSPIGARSGEKAAALRVHGGGDETEVAVSEALRWLARHQDNDGSWDPHGFTRHCPPGRPCGGPGYPEYRVGVTALCVLAFLGVGVDGVQDQLHRDVVRDGLAYLLASQRGSGCLGPREGNYMYNHAIATFCLAEAAIMTEDERYRVATERGLDFSSSTQQPGGGWDYTAAPTLRNDLSITGWQIMAIYTAKQARIPANPIMIRKVKKYIRRAVQKSGWSTYADRGIGKNRGGVSIAAVGLLSKLYLGWSPRSPELKNAAEIIVTRPPDDLARVDWRRTYQSSYYWYYGTLGLFHMGGKRWEAWNTYMKRSVLPMQREGGHREGSWDPDPNWIGASGGRIATTALNLLSFEVYYRYKPLYQKFGLKKPSRTPDPSSEGGSSRRTPR